ncbi:MAG: AraC family transcriptional regulator [Lachnospiraceae bacterium]
MDLKLFRKLLQNLLNTDVRTYDNDIRSLAALEEACCFQKALQPMFTADSLSYLLGSMNDTTFYEIVDKLDVCLFFFQFEKNIFLIGPYVRTEYSDEKMQNILIENKMPASYATSLRLYYTAMPLLGAYQIQRTVTACMVSFNPLMHEYTYRKLLGFQEEPKEPKTYRQDSIDYSAIYQRYHVENRLLKLIEKGDVENIIQAYDEMQDESASLADLFRSPVYQSPISILRALARKAAEQSGLSIITIDQITQKSVQRLSGTDDIEKQGQYCYEMLIELTTAVRDHLVNTSGYSSAIVKVVEHLSLNYTQNINMDILCQISDYSSSHLAKIFKHETGRTITQYIANLRCRQAAEMLRETNLPVQEISSYVGYTDNNYFVKVFKKVIGNTPSEYRALTIH